MRYFLPRAARPGGRVPTLSCPRRCSMHWLPCHPGELQAPCGHSLLQRVQPLLLSAHASQQAVFETAAVAAAAILAAEEAVLYGVCMHTGAR